MRWQVKLVIDVCLHRSRTFKKHYWQLLLPLNKKCPQKAVLSSLRCNWFNENTSLMMFTTFFPLLLLNISLIQGQYISFWAVWVFCFFLFFFIELQLRRRRGFSMLRWHHWRTHLNSLSLRSFHTKWNSTRAFIDRGYVLGNVHNKFAQHRGQYLQKEALTQPSKWLLYPALRKFKSMWSLIGCVLVVVKCRGSQSKWNVRPESGGVIFYTPVVLGFYCVC